ncbi:putative bifunctional diguanylate cyclase/phosphodiesterase [Mycolicibacterium sp.]|uniref:putative bifunctional diguanylate cyclase/phosphodiesterase n=1 Tax=Mycolicibacterium sp. TaxID=2320850 RepID=UPI003D0A8C20
MPYLRGVAAGAVIVGGGYAAWLLGDWGGLSVIRMVDDLGLVGFSLVALICTAFTARRARGEERTGWILISIGTGGWVLGEAIWSYYDLVHEQVLLPSMADAGYVAFLIGAALGLLFLLRAYSPDRKLRLLLDGIIVAAAIFGAAWASLLDTVYAARVANPVSLAVSLSYPVVDIVLLTMSTLLLVRVAPARRLQMALMTAGLLCITLSDVAFAYLTAVDGLYEHHVIAIGWAWGFLAISFSALLAARAPVAEPRLAQKVPSRSSAWLPYLPVVASAAICTPGLLGTIGPVGIAAAVAVYAVAVRQFLVIVDNRRLLVEIADQALREPLTGLANRTLFADRLEHAMALHHSHRLGVAVVLIDLDHFKVVNDSFGHPAGDQMLIRVAERLTATARPTDTVARFGGDEFALLMEGDVAASLEVAQRVTSAFDRPFVIEGRDLLVRPSIGLAIADADDGELTADELLRRADVAMYTAKRTRSGELFTFTPEMDLHQPTDAVVAPGQCGGNDKGSACLLGELRHAIDNFALSMVYQPKFDLRSGQIVGVEALIRWPHPRRGLLLPNEFLPLVRQHGLMRSVTSMVIELALDDAARWYDQGLGVPLAINVFAPAVCDADLDQELTRALDRRGLAPDALTVEITEDLLLDNMGRTRSIFNTLRDKGIRVAIDDFGSGYSALWYLREFPVDEVKLDREFIAPILTQPTSAAIVRAVIDLAHALDVTPVAEGVENAETAARLLDYGCEVAQGFHYSPPLPAPAIFDLLASQKRAGALVPGGLGY